MNAAALSIPHEMPEDPGSDSLTSPLGIGAHALEFLMSRLQRCQSTGPDDLPARLGHPQADARCLKCTPIQCMPALGRSCGLKIVKMSLEKRNKARVGEISSLDTQTHGAIMTEPCFGQVSPGLRARAVRRRR